MAAPVAQVAAPAAPAVSIAYSTLNAPADGYIVERDLGIVFGVAIGANYNLTFNIQKAMQNAVQSIEQSRNSAMATMGQSAAARGANIVLGVTFDTEREGGYSIVTCSGTACVVRAKA